MNDKPSKSLFRDCRQANDATRKLCSAARRRLRDLLIGDADRVDSTRLEQNQYVAHGIAWLLTYGEALEQMLAWATKLEESDQATPLDYTILQCAFGEYLSQISGGIPMSQGEYIRPIDMGLAAAALAYSDDEAVKALSATGNSVENRVRIAQAVAKGDFGRFGENDTDRMIRDQFHRFSQDKILPHAHEWHLQDKLIPLDVIKQMSDLGVFGIAIPEQYAGLGMGKVAMCIVTEELSRAFLAAGSLSTRAEIAAELIQLGGTEAQKKDWLPRIASGEILTTAVFTEPNVGSDLAHLGTRGVLKDDHYHVHGAKTWITHGARSDLMTLLVRTDTQEKGYRGLSMLLAEKPRGNDDTPFPADGMQGSEIEVLGYRGMKEYEIAFDDFKVPAANLLGGKEGQGFKQLMATFESARIQTAARAVGVAQSALDSAIHYAGERVQFGKTIIHFPRIAAKIGWMAVETMIARQITFHSARAKDSDKRCDIEAGMAKLLSARIAWSNADNALQIHGGNGYALEYPISRILCDARILNIFEGAAEIQAGVIARGLALRDEDA